MNAQLNNLKIVNTRPKHQASHLSDLLQQHGADVLECPALAITPLPSHTIFNTYQALPSPPDIIIFISANAVKYALPHGSFDTNTTTIALGPGTANALIKSGFPNPIIPHSYNTEGVLALAQTHAVEQKHILIVCGQPSKPNLAHTLVSRGAHVSLLPCYQRKASNFPELTPLIIDTVDVFITTSLLSLSHLTRALETLHPPTLASKAVLVISPAMAHAARAKGWRQQIITSDNASDAAIIEALITWHNDQIQ